MLPEPPVGVCCDQSYDDHRLICIHTSFTNWYLHLNTLEKPWKKLNISLCTFLIKKYNLLIYSAPFRSFRMYLGNSKYRVLSHYMQTLTMIAKIKLVASFNPNAMIFFNSSCRFFLSKQAWFEDKIPILLETVPNFTKYSSKNTELIFFAVVSRSFRWIHGCIKGQFEIQAGVHNWWEKR